MAQLRRGARQTLDYLIADLNDAYDLVKRNPDAARTLIERSIERIRADVEPMLQRAAPSLEKRVDDIEAQIELLKQRIQHP